MRRIAAIVLALALLGLAGCGGERQLPPPEELYRQISQAVELPEMVDVTDMLLLADTGIDPQSCQGAVYYVPSAGISPEEIIIVQADTPAQARVFQEKLEARLEYQEDSARVYLTQFMPVIQQGVVRLDGTIVSLIVSQQVEDILALYP